MTASAGPEVTPSDSRARASALVCSNLIGSSLADAADAIPQKELIVRGAHNSSNASKPLGNGSVTQSTFLSRLVNLQRNASVTKPDQRDFEDEFPPSQVHLQQYRSVSRSSAYGIPRSPNHNFKLPSLSSPLAVPSSPVNRSSDQSHAISPVLSFTPQSLKRPFGSLVSATGHAACTGSAFFPIGNTGSSTPGRGISSSNSRPRPFIPLRVASRGSGDSSAIATLEQTIEHTRKKIKVNRCIVPCAAQLRYSYYPCALRRLIQLSAIVGRSCKTRAPAEGRN